MFLSDPDNTPAPSLSRGMLVVSWLVVLGMLTLVFGNWEERRQNPNREPITRLDASGRQEVVLERNRYGHYVANGFINGREVTLLLDTGATDVAIPENMASQLGLKKMARGTASTANGLVDIYFTRLDSLVIGHIEFNDVAASINPGMNHDDTVLLGMSALKDIEFTQRRNQLTLKKIR